MAMIRSPLRTTASLQLEDQDKIGRRAKIDLDPNIRRLLDDLTDRLGARVEIQQGTKGTGKLLIAYNSLDELDGILAHIK